MDVDRDWCTLCHSRKRGGLLLKLDSADLFQPLHTNMKVPA